MNLKRQITVLCALALGLSGPVLANEIYKWTDAEGNVHYGDRPSGDPSEERMHITYSRTNSSAVQARVATRRESDEQRREAAAERDGEDQAAADARAEREAREAKCTEFRGKLETMLTAPRLYREDENGERVYLDDAERQEARQRAEERIAEYCGS